MAPLRGLVRGHPGSPRSPRAPRHPRGGATSQDGAASARGAAGAAHALTALTGQLVLANFLPPFLGLWQAEYGVSYGYGLATALSGALLLARGLPMPVVLHAGCLCFYGARLSLFLLYRETCIARFREFRDRIEERSRESGSRWSRLPFLSACAVLYLGLAAPVAMASTAACTASATLEKLLIYKIAVPGLSSENPLRFKFLRKMSPVVEVCSEEAALSLSAVLFFVFSFCSFFFTEVVLMCSGCLVAALGDVWKSVAKARRGSDALVTDGPYALLRHPNYTGDGEGRRGGRGGEWSYRLLLRN